MPEEYGIFIHAVCEGLASLQEAKSDIAPALNWREILEADVVRLAADRSKRVHAVLDGAFFDNPRYHFDKFQLAARPLFGGNTPQAMVEAGPWLVDLYHLPFRETKEDEAPESNNSKSPDLTDDALAAEADAMAEAMRQLIEAGDETGGLAPALDEGLFRFGPQTDPAEQIRALIKLAGDKPALVFWIGNVELTHERLFKHLRSINKVLIPKEGETQDAREAVLFRHADGNALASVLPVLDENQFARLFGPALALTFHAPDFPDKEGWPIRRAVLPLPAATAPAGMLALRSEQMRGVETARLERSQRRIVTYLRKVAPDQIEKMSATELAKKTALLMTEGRALGVRTEAGLGRWCYLQVITAGEMGRQKSVTDFVTKRNLGNNPSASTDERVEILMWMASAQAQRMRQ